MRYVDISRHGGPEVLVLREAAAPTPGDGELLIQVHAAGVNRPDVMQRQGLYPAPAGASPVPGLEVAGSVAAVGPQVSGWSIGDPVCALTNGGGYAQFVAVPQGQCLPVPSGLSVTEAAALPEACFTVWANVLERARLKAGESFLVHGGACGIGTFAIQMAAAFGATVYATAGGREKCRVCEDLGAAVAVDYTAADFVAVLKAATDGRGVDVILDMVGGDYVGRNLRLAARDGRIVSIAFIRGSTVSVDLMPVLLKRLTVTGSTLRSRSAAAKASIAARLRSRVWPLIESGRIRPLVSARYPLAEAAEAHRLMESGAHMGKIVLTVDH